MKKIFYTLAIFFGVSLIPLFTTVYAADGMPPLTQMQKEIREEGYSDGIILGMLTLVISGTVLSVIFFRKDIKKKLRNKEK